MTPSVKVFNGPRTVGLSFVSSSPTEVGSTPQRIKTITKVTLNKIGSGYRSSNALNADFDTIEEGFERSLSRTETSSNQMEVPLDMNSHRIINLGAPSGDNDAVRLKDVLDIQAGGSIDLQGKANSDATNIDLFVEDWVDKLGVAKADATNLSSSDIEAWATKLGIDPNRKGFWNAQTNTPTLVSSEGTEGAYYIISVPGTTDLDGVDTWNVGDIAVFSDGAWVRIEAADAGASNLNYLRPEDFGAIGDNIVNDTQAFKDMIAAANHGDSIRFVSNKQYVITDTILIDKRLFWDGNGSKVRYGWSTAEGGPGFCRPMFVFVTGSESSTVEHIHFDHDGFNCPGATLASAPGPGGWDGLPLAWQGAILYQASDINVSHCRVDNAWDNAFSVGKFTVTGSGTVGSPYVLAFADIDLSEPKRVVHTNCLAFRAGSGRHFYPSIPLAGDWERVGAGFNNLNGGFAKFDTCVSIECATGFVSDFGAQASSTFDSCLAFYSKEDTHNPNNGSGWGFWFADGPNSAVNCQASFCDKEGFVVPFESASTLITGCTAFACGYDGFLIGASTTTVTGCIAQSSGLRGNAAKSSGFVLDSSGGALNHIVMVGNIADANGVSQYGLRARGANAIVAQWTGGSLSGLTSQTDIGTYAVAVFSQGSTNRNIGFNVDEPESRFQIGAGAFNHTITALGDTGNGGAFAVSGAGANVKKKVAMSYDVEQDVGVIQSIHADVTKKPLLLNPSGGYVKVGQGTWNTGPIRINDMYMWSDGSGVLRVKQGAPASATDASAGQFIARTILARDFYSADGVYTYDAGGTMYVRKEGSEIVASHTMRAPAFTPICDIKYKINIRPIEDDDEQALARTIRAVPTVHQRHTDGEDGKDYRGFIAQWLQEGGLAHWTSEADNGDLAFDPVSCITDLVMSIRELKKQVDSLKK